jgi:iron complex transport system substrate-binding protein
MNYIKKFIYFIVGAALVSGLLASCGVNINSSEEHNTRNQSVVRDAIGHKVKIPAHPKRIIAPYLEDYLTALHIRPVAQWSVNNGKEIQFYLQKNLKGVPTIPYDLPFESVASFKPDLILIGDSSQVQGDKYQQYNKIAPTYVVTGNGNLDWRTKLLKIGTLFGKKTEAEKVIANYKQKARQASKKITRLVGRPTVAAIWLTNNQFYIVNKSQSSGAVLYHDLGLKAPAIVDQLSKSSNASWTPVSLEKLAELKADDLFLVNSDQSNGSKMLKNPIWNKIPAVKMHHVYQYNSKSSWLYSGPVADSRMIDDLLNNFSEQRDSQAKK